MSGYNEHVPSYFPSGAGLSYYQKGLRYFTRFDGFGDGYDIVAVEEAFHFHIDGFPFVGFTDLVLQDKTTDDLVVVCHKSKSAKSKKQLAPYRHQLYLYAAAVEKRFGRAPSLLRLNLFRDGVMIDEPFRPEEQQHTFAWARDTIHTITHEKTWGARSLDYYCHFVCTVTQSCPVMRDYIEGK